MSKDLQESISALRKSKWVNLSALVDFATTRLSKPACQSIELLGYGTYNNVYKLVFVDGSEIAASLARHDEEDFNPQAKLSEIATMQFVRTSGLYPDIVIPQLYAWDVTFTNPVGAPYVLMDVICGRNLNRLNNAAKLWGLDAMSEVQQLAVTKTLAKLQSALSAPVPFDKIGSITLDDEGKFVVGPLLTISQDNLGGPYQSIADLWKARLEHEILHALKEWCRLESDQLSRSLEEPKCTPQEFSELFQLLSSLIPHFVPSSSYLPLTLHHPDLALRNVIFHPTDDTKIVGLLDWGGAQILPLMFTAQFPADYISTADDPCEREGIPDEDWRTIPHDWTSFYDSSKWIECQGANNETVDQTIRGSAMIKQYYLRQHFGVCYAQENHDRYGDYNLGRAMLFAHAPYYLKFHEILKSGWAGWVNHAMWIRETYWRINAGKQDLRGPALIVGPNVYRSSMETLVCDLGIFEEQSSENDQDVEE
ncbi:hypothetical protein M405DRAFT_835299 [Rhizopogon salebrosus TDB-379]|nr:hypothetical protein M405DRAFT_835299 [Rhizopogon salebrosus TDB-379]